METNHDASAADEHVRVCNELVSEVAKVVVGQEAMISRLVVGLLTGGHVLLEGVPGLAKTLSVRSLSTAIDTDFSRIQFTPDMLPADVVGTEIFNPREGTYSVKQGPIFSNLVLADEINRAPAKVQAALLEAMQERQVTIGDTTYHFDEPFLVLATQNPIEQEGTYPLPEAQVDRFMLKVVVGYPSKEEEREDRRSHGERSARARGSRRWLRRTSSLAARKVVAAGLHRREGEGLRRRPRPCDAGSEVRRDRGPGRDDRDRRFAACFALPDPARRRRTPSSRAARTRRPHDVKELALDVLRHQRHRHLRSRSAGKAPAKT